MSPRLGLLCVLVCSSAVRADEVAVFLDDTKGLTRGQELSLLSAAKVALRELSGMQVKDLPPPPADRPRAPCGKGHRCLLALAASAKVQFALALTASASGGVLSLDGALIDADGELFTAPKPAQGDTASPEVAAASLARGLLPPFLRKGFGGLRIDAPAGATLKLDGRRIGQAPLSATQVATAGPHEVDALFADGTATLERVRIPEGGRLRLSLQPAPVARRSEGPSEAKLYASYGLFTAGALAIASSFVAAAGARTAAAGAQPCEGADRNCTSFGDAQALSSRAAGQTRTANVLLGAGALLSLSGVGLFTYHHASTPGAKP